MTRRANPGCPICGKPREPEFRPFCSKRCADVDLNRWLSGAYAIPAAPAGEGDEEAAAPPPSAPSPHGGD